MPGNIASSQPDPTSTKLDAGLEALAKTATPAPAAQPATPVAVPIATKVATSPDPVLKPSTMVANGSTPGAGAMRPTTVGVQTDVVEPPRRSGRGLASWSPPCAFITAGS